MSFFRLLYFILFYFILFYFFSSYHHILREIYKSLEEKSGVFLFTEFEFSFFISFT